MIGNGVRVVAVTPNYPPSSRVGAWLATHEHLRAVAARGHRVDVLPAATLGGPRVVDGVHVSPVRGRLEPKHLAGADVVVSHLGDNGRAHQIATDLGIPSVVMAHGFPTRDPVAQWATVPPTLVVWNSENLRAAVGWAGPGVVVHPHTDMARHRTTPGDRFTLVNLSEAKGGKVLSRLAKALPDVQFLGVRGHYGRQLVQFPPNVEVIEATRHMARDVWSRTRVLLMPSERETWGMVGVEAMASGIPVLAAPTGGLRESLDDAGIFVDRGDVPGWVRAVRRLCDPGEWAAASARSSGRAATLAEERPSEQFADVLERVARREVVDSGNRNS